MPIDMPASIEREGAEAMKELDEIRKGSAGQPTTEEADPNAGAAAAPKVAETARTTTTSADLQAQLEALQKRFDTQEGRHGTAVQAYQEQLRASAEEMRRSTETIIRLESRIRELETAKPQSTATPPPGGATPASVIPAAGTPEFEAIMAPKLSQELGADLAGEIFSLIRRATAPVASEVERVKQQQAEREKAEKAERERSVEAAHNARVDRMWLELETRVPGARAINGDPALKLPGDPLFATFMGERHPDAQIPNLTIGQAALTEALKSAEGSPQYKAAIDSLSSLFNRFLAWKDVQTGAAPRPGEKKVTPPPVSAHATPQKGPAAPPAQDGVKPRLKQSEYDAFYADYVQHPDKYTIEEVNKRNADYIEAAREGRLDEDA